MPLIFDGHLDLAMNALGYERDQRLPVDDLRAFEVNAKDDGRETPTVTIDAMQKAGVACCVATVIARTKRVKPERNPIRRNLDYPTQDIAHGAAMGQLAYYESLQRQGVIDLINTAGELQEHWSRWQGGALDAPVGVIVTMEGADPIVEPEEVHHWYARGVRTLMLSHTADSPYAFGTPPWDSVGPPEQGPLTDKGRRLLDEMSELNMPLDLTHLCDQSFHEAVERFTGPIYASHSNCRALATKHRQLTDEQLKIIIERDGLIGTVLCNSMLRDGTPETLSHELVGLDALAEHIDHICQLAGDARHVAIGSDLDGGFGREWSPREIDTIADLHVLEDVLAKRGYSSDDVALVMSGNWLRYWLEHLPD